MTPYFIKESDSFCKNAQGYCDPTTRTQATIVWFPEDTSTTFQVAEIHARMIKFHQKCFTESILYNDVNPETSERVIIILETFII